MDKETTLSLLHNIDAYDFEQVIADLWERQGWTTRVTQSSNDKGIDVIAERTTPFSQKVVIQAKRYEPTSSVSSTEVQQYSSLRQQVDGVDSVIIATTARFSDQAEETAEALNVKLIDGAKLYELFESSDGFDILHQYLDKLSGVNSKESNEVTAVPTGVDTEEPEPDIISVDHTSPRTEPDNSHQEATPENLAEVIDLKESLSDELKHVDEIANEAREAFESKEFDRAVGLYTDARNKLLELQSELTRYESGFEQIDSTAASHLTSPSEFQTATEERKDQFDHLISEAEELAEQADALKRLATEVNDDAARAQSHLNDGDQARNQERFEKAREHYEKSLEALTETEDTLKTYNALAAEYERALPTEKPELPASIDVDQLRAKLQDRLDQDSEEVVERDFHQEATHDSVTNDRMTETYEGGGFTNEPITSYLEPDETPHFSFHSSIKGYKHEDEEGSKTKHSPDSEFASHYVVTDRRVLIVTGHDEGDIVTELSQPILSEYSIGRLKKRLTLFTDWDKDGEKYHFWIDSDYDESALEAAQEFLLPAKQEKSGEMHVNPTNSAKQASGEAVQEQSVDSNASDEVQKPNQDNSKEDRKDSNHTSNSSPAEIVDKASGSFSENILTQKDSRLIDQRLIDYLVPDEELEYVFWHQYKGFRITEPNGTEKTPHHDSTTTGSRFLLITNKQLCYVAGLDSHDEVMIFDYEEITSIDTTKTLTKNLIEFTVSDGTEYRFAETGTHGSDISDAGAYIEEQISEEY